MPCAGMAAHLQTLLECCIHSLKLLRDQGLLHWQDGGLHTVVDAHNQLQVSYLLAEHHIPFIDLHDHSSACTRFKNQRTAETVIPPLQRELHPMICYISNR